ncbi:MULTISPECIES: hypothetical protein [unclassified Chelatococcus]|uniref:hypothetical protein n=1 Tax=unclassified Chelatococcus TaxID=2638111 RepID=UPI001BD012A9|nr:MULTISPECIES: hypothetical protein [unclassified Chelatococcus]MBS7737929.1 hypothetical protein [Chelatococcus sp. HY11]MCO5077102.1 hypothetical protein [Chelatococcus sp.]
MPAMLPGQRPRPPAGLTAKQKREWGAVVNRLPADWFTRETHALLVQYVRHVERADILAKAIDKFPPADLETEDGVERYDKLTKMAEREGRALSSLATRMRLTQQSRYNAKNANTGAEKAGTASTKPWES